MAEPYKAMDDEDLLAQVRRCYKLVVDTEAQQRIREREDLLFQLPENQWSDAAKTERRGGNIDGIQYPARPMMSVSLLRQPMQLVYNQFTKARLGVNLHPISENASKEQAEAKQGLYRRIERDGGAGHARSWAFMRGLIAGRGWYRINTKYDEDADPKGPGAWDQEIIFQRFLHQESVCVDPAAQEPDFSDMAWAFVVSWLSKRQAKREFPKSRMALSGTDVLGWDGLAQEAPGWVKSAAGEDDEQGVMVAEYWHRDIHREEITDPSDPERKRIRETPHVTCYKVNGVEVLERQKWDGKYIPLVPVIGEELQPVDGDRIWQGMVRPARDAQMGYNYAISAQLEDISRLSKSPYVGPVGAFETDRVKWESLNVRPYLYVQYDTIDVEGKPAAPPTPMQIDGTKLQLSVAFADQTKGMVQASTAVHEPSLGELPGRRDAQSGRAILALQSQSDAGTSQFAQNIETITLPCEARIILDLMPYVYDRPGRVTALVTGEDETSNAMIGTPYVQDKKTGMPIPAQPNDPQAKTFDLSKGKYGISIDVGKSAQTRLQAGQQFLTEVISGAPQLMNVIGDLVFKFRDEPGAKEIAERLRRTIPPNILGEDKGAPEQMEAELQATKQQLEQVGQQAAQMADMLKTEQAKQQAQVAIAQGKQQSDVAMAQLKSQSDLEIARMNNAAKVLIARIGSQFDKENTEAEIQEELLSTGLKIEAEREARHEEMAHDVAMAAGGGQTMKMSKTQGQDGEREDSQERSDGQTDTPRPEASE